MMMPASPNSPVIPFLLWSAAQRLLLALLLCVPLWLAVGWALDWWEAAP
ncbi:hypothetical protein [Insolitispirillum peregrinum]